MNRRIEKLVEGAYMLCLFEELREGDTFRAFETDGTFCGVYVALGDPVLLETTNNASIAVSWSGLTGVFRRSRT